MKVYCENGAYRKELKSLEESGKIVLMNFVYEQKKNQKIKKMAIPSKLTWSNNFLTWDSTEVKFSNGYPSIKYEKIKKIVGGNNLNDINHIDSAYISGCKCFLTPDKNDIWNKRKELESLTGIKFFYPNDPISWQEFLELVEKRE